MAGSKEYAVVLALRATDQATSVVRGVVGRLRSVQAELKSFGHDPAAAATASLRRLHEMAGSAAGRIRGMLAPALAATGLGAATSAGGLWKLTTGAAKTGDELFKLSRQLGVSGQAIKEWRYVAKQAGIDADTMDGAVAYLNRTIGQAANGTGKGAAVFKALGIGLKDANGQVKSADAVMMDLSAKMGKIPDAAQRAAVAAALFGKEGGAQLAPMLAQGTAEIQRQRAQMAAFGTTTQEQLQAAHNFSLSVARMQGALSGLGNAIGNKLYPQLQPVIDKFADLLISARPKISKAIGELVGRVIDGVKSIDWSMAINGAIRFANVIQTGVEVIGGWSRVLAGVAMVMASGPILSTLNLIKEITKLGVAAILTGGKLLWAFGSGLVMSIYRVGVGLVKTKSLVQAFNMAWKANPIGLVITAVTTLVGLGTVLYANFEPVRKVVDGIVDAIKSAAKIGLDWVGKLLGIDLTGGAKKLMAAINAPDPADEVEPEQPGAAQPAPGKGAPGPAKPGGAPAPGAVAPAAPANPAQMTISPAPAARPLQGEIKIKIDSPVPAKVEEVKSDAGLKIRHDLNTGQGRAGQG